jgi:hypothetical protein
VRTARDGEIQKLLQLAAKPVRAQRRSRFVPQVKEQTAQLDLHEKFS